MAIGIGIGTIFKSSASGSSYWTPSKPLGGETPSFWYKENSRSGLTLTDSISSPANDISILLPHLYRNNGEYAYVNDNGALDIGATDFTLCGWINNTQSKAAYRYFFGKHVSGGVNGRYGIYADITTGYFACSVQSSGGNKAVTSTIDSTTAGWKFLLLEVDQTASVLRFFIDNVQIGTDLAYTGTFPAMGNNYRFYVGAANTLTTGAVTAISNHNTASIRVYNKKLTPTEKTTLFNQGHVTGTKAYYPLNNELLIDSSNNGYHLTGYNITRANIKYSAFGSRQSLEVGYSRYTLYKNKEVQIPFTDVSTPCTYAPAGYTDEGDIVGISNGHNLADSYIMLPTGTIDRSSTTTCDYLARDTTLQHYYDVTYKGGLNVLELDNCTLSNYFKDDYRGKLFSKIAGRTFKELFGYTTNKTGVDYSKAIKYSGETGILTFEATTGPHICAVKGNKVLKFDDVHTFSLSYDSGVTYTKTLVTTLSLCDYAFIFDNGNIMFCDSTKIYYSTDDLTSYHESTVLGVDGNPFVAGTVQNFRTYNADFSEVTHDGTKLHTWGNYVTSGTAESDNVNQWYTIDSGLTVKSGYKFGTSVPSAVCRHIHQIIYDSNVDKFYMITGDDDADHDNFMRGTYSTATDTWTWEIIGKGDGNSIWENGGMWFDSTNFYFVGEQSASYKGIKKSLKSDIANIATNQKMLFIPNKWSVGAYGRDGYFILTEGGEDGSNHITFSTDNNKFFTRLFSQLTVLVPYGCFLCIGRLATGYFVFHCIENGETIDNYTKGATLLVKPTVIS